MGIRFGRSCGGLCRSITLRDSSPQRHRGHGEKTKKLCDLCVSVVSEDGVRASVGKKVEQEVRSLVPCRI